VGNSPFSYKTCGFNSPPSLVVSFLTALPLLLFHCQGRAVSPPPPTPPFSYKTCGFSFHDNPCNRSTITEIEELTALPLSLFPCQGRVVMEKVLLYGEVWQWLFDCNFDCRTCPRPLFGS